MNLALAYERAGRMDEALAQLRRSLDLRPASAEAWVAMGNIQRQLGDVAAAEQAYRTALAHQPRLAGVYHNLGNIEYSDRGRVQAAISLYERCLQLDDSMVQARNNLGQAYEAAGRPEEALEQYQRAVNDSLCWAHPWDSELGGAWYNLARLREKRGDRHGAAAAYGRALTILRRYPELAAYAAEAEAGAVRMAAGTP